MLIGHWSSVHALAEAVPHGLSSREPLSPHGKAMREYAGHRR